MSITTAQNPKVQVLWLHTQNNISLRMLDIDYGYWTQGISALVVKLEIVNTTNDDTTEYYFEDNMRVYYKQYLQQYVNGQIRNKAEFDTKGFFRPVQDLFKSKAEKDPAQFKNLELLIEGSKIFGANYIY
jgi:hypothetical protein